MNHSIWYRWPNYATWPWGITRYIRKQGVPARVRLFASERDLQETIDQNRIVIVLIGGGAWGGIAKCSPATILNKATSLLIPVPRKAKRGVLLFSREMNSCISGYTLVISSLR